MERRGEDATMTGVPVSKTIVKKNLTDQRQPERRAVKQGGGIAKKARQELEARTGRKVVTGENFLPPTAKRALPEKKRKKK